MAKPGTGFRVRNGTTTRFEDQGSGSIRGTSTFNDAGNPFNAQRTDVHPLNWAAEAATRYFGGDRSLAGNRRAQGHWGEAFAANIFAIAAAYQAMKRGEIVGLPQGAYWEPGDWDGEPTIPEGYDLAFIVTRRDPFYLANSPSVEGDSRTPEHPKKIIGASSCPGFADLPRYFVLLDNSGHPSYFDQEICKPGVGYSAARTWEGKKVPAYPHVFGEPATPAPTPPPPSPPLPTPEPPKPPEPKPEPIPLPAVPDPFPDDAMRTFDLAPKWPELAGKPGKIARLSRLAREAQRIQAALLAARGTK